VVGCAVLFVIADCRGRQSVRSPAPFFHFIAERRGRRSVQLRISRRVRPPDAPFFFLERQNAAPCYISSFARCGLWTHRFICNPHLRNVGDAVQLAHIPQGAALHGAASGRTFLFAIADCRDANPCILSPHGAASGRTALHYHCGAPGTPIPAIAHFPQGATSGCAAFSLSLRSAEDVAPCGGIVSRETYSLKRQIQFCRNLGYISISY